MPRVRFKCLSVDSLLTTFIGNVLVIEAGPLDEGEDAFIIPRLQGSGPAKYYYNLTSIPQPGAYNRTFGLTAGHLVGGGSAVNGMFFDRGYVRLSGLCLCDRNS